MQEAMARKRLEASSEVSWMLGNQSSKQGAGSADLDDAGQDLDSFVFDLAARQIQLRDSLVCSQALKQHL